MEYRLYTFINFYLSAIQQGIQTAHIVHELFNQYPGKGNFHDDSILWNWSQNHKTIIVLNGGSEVQLKELDLAIEHMLDPAIAIDNGTPSPRYQLPYTSFQEDAGLGHIRTGIGIVLPASLYDAQYDREADHFKWQDLTGAGGDADVSDQVFYYSGSTEYAFLKLLKSKRLAS